MGWIVHFCVCVIMDPNCVSVHKHGKKKSFANIQPSYTNKTELKGAMGNG